MNEILIYDDIGASWFDEGVTAKGVKEQLDGMSGDVTVRINSGGGDVFEGFAIYNLLDQHQGDVTIHIDGLAASAASVIAMAGNNVHMADNALMMIHDPWTFAIGNAADLTKTTELLDKIKDSIADTYIKKTGIEYDKISNWMSDETWFNSVEAIKHGFANEKEEKEAKAMNFGKPWIKNAPKTDNKLLNVENKNQQQVLNVENTDKQEFYKASLYKRKLELIKQD